MPESLAALEQLRTAILQQIVELPDFRTGSITTTSGTCGKPNKKRGAKPIIAKAVG